MLCALASRFRARLVTGSVEPVRLQALEASRVSATVVTLGSRRLPAETWRVVSATASGQPYVMFARHDRARVRRAVLAAVAADPPDILYLDHLDSLVYADVAPGAAVVMDLHNIYSLIAARAARETAGVRRAFLAREARLLEKMERRAAARADLLMAVSEDEAAYYRRLGATDVQVVPNGVDCARYMDLPVGRAGRPATMMYLGAMSWQPNASAATYLAEEVLPRVRACIPDARLRIVGRDPSPQVRALSRLPGVDVTGAVDDLRPHLLESHVLAVPLETGGGTRLKILEAFAAGLPVVSTAVGAEGIDAIPGREFVQAERPEFSQAIVDVFRDSARAADRAAAARQLVRARYDWSAVGGKAVEAIHGTVNRRAHLVHGRCC